MLIWFCTAALKYRCTQLSVTSQSARATVAAKLYHRGGWNLALRNIIVICLFFVVLFFYFRMLTRTSSSGWRKRGVWSMLALSNTVILSAGGERFFANLSTSRDLCTLGIHSSDSNEQLHFYCHCREFKTEVVR